jgi:CRISPR-associated protein Cas2
MYLVCYDVADNRRRYRLDKLLSGYGIRAQRSVFECAIDAGQAAELEAAAQNLLEPEEDRLHLYHLCGKDCEGRLCHGIAERIEPPAFHVG